MKTKLLDVIDFEKVDTLLEGFNKSTGFLTAILDLEGNVLSKSGWRQICTQFHRVHPETSKKCTISDTVLAGKLAEGEKYHFYQCLNGLVDVAVPIVIKGEHIANLFSGQFFFEDPDNSFFIKQAEKYDFNEKIYLKALGQVPVVSKEKVKTAMDFLLAMTLLISDLALEKAKQFELNKQISEAKEKAEESEEKYRLLAENSTDVIWVLDVESDTFRYISPSIEHLRGYTAEEVMQKGLANALTPASLEYLRSVVPGRLARFRQGQIEFFHDEIEQIHKDGRTIWTEVNARYFVNRATGRVEATGATRDIAERKQAENALLAKMDELERFHKLTVGREIAMVALKKEVNNLLNKLGQDHKYKIVE